MISNRPKLSIVVPSYNESWEVKKEAIDTIANFLVLRKIEAEVLIVDDESTNNTLEKVKDYLKNKKNFSLVANKHGGKAITVMTGMLKSRGETVLFTDMDQATPINQLEKILPKFKDGYDIVIGARKGRSGAPIIRKLMAFGFAFLRNIFLGLPYPDTQCGFKAFSRRSVEAIFPGLLREWEKRRIGGASVNAGFDVETLFLAKKKGFKIASVDVLWHHVENVRQVQVLTDSLAALKDLFRIKIGDFLGRYG